MIGLYEDKIKLLENTQDQLAAEPDKTRINEKGERVKAGKIKKQTVLDPEKIDYFKYFSGKRS